MIEYTVDGTCTHISFVWCSTLSYNGLRDIAHHSKYYISLQYLLLLPRRCSSYTKIMNIAVDLNSKCYMISNDGYDSDY